MAENLYRDISDQDDFFFLSYKKENVALLREIVPHLQFNVWYDFGIGLTEIWTEEIVSHIKKSRAVILFLSRDVLRPGVDSFVYKEYSVARRSHKDVLVVFLEEINDEDIPDSLAIWFETINSGQCLRYRPERTKTEWINQIHTEVERYTHRKKEKHAPEQARMLQLNLCSNFLSNQYIYMGMGDTHLSEDRRKICLYNAKAGVFEVRLMNNYGYLVARFKEKPEILSKCRIFFTQQNDCLFYILDSRIYIYNLITQKRSAPQGIKLKTESGETIESLYQMKKGGKVCLLTRRNGYLYHILVFNVREGKTESIWDVSKHKLRCEVCTLNNQTTEVIAFSNADDEIVMIDLRKMERVSLTYDQLLEFLHEPEYLLSEVDNKMSHDGLLYAARSNGNVRVLDMRSGSKIDEDYDGNYQDMYLLNNGTVLKFDLSGCVYQITAGGKQKLFDEAYFRSQKEFNGNIPHTMFYDELQDLYLFVVNVAPDSVEKQRVIIVNRNGGVYMVSNELSVPFSSRYFVRCSIVRGELLVMFSNMQQNKKTQQSTFVYRGEYK